MTKPNFPAQIGELSNAIATQLSTNGTDLCRKVYDASVPLLHWIDYLHMSERTGCCDEFLDGLRAGIVETASCISMGLVRPAIFSMRAQIDVALSWLYFKDHPVEWSHVEAHGEGFMLKSDVIGYLSEYSKVFRTRFDALVSVKMRREDDPYRLLSAHVHSQSKSSLPSYTHLKTVIASKKRCAEAVELQKEVTEYLGDVFLSCFGSKWASLPSSILEAARNRLGSDKAAKVFA